MPLPTIAGVVRVAVRGHTAYGTRWVNILHLKRIAGSPSAADFPAIVTLLNQLYGGATFGGGGANLLSASNASTGADDYTFTSLDSSIASVVLTATAAGTGAASSLPAEVAEVITIRTGQRGRRYRGRIFLPPMTTTNVIANGTLAASLATSIPAQCSGFQTALGALGTPYTWGVASYGRSVLKNGTVSTWNPFFNSASSWSFDLIPDVQRRRKS